MTSEETNNNAHLDRYRRQLRYAPLGEKGQRRLLQARVLVVGSGALGCVVADTLVRAGVGFVRLVDRDFVEVDNLHRQVLFDEADAEAQLPKAIAAARRLARINSTIEIDPIVADLNATNIRQLADDVELIVDGTDNFETRYLLNDYAVANKKPWIFGGCVGAEGQTLAIVPGETPCLSCIMPEPPPAAAQPTCETAGVLGPIVNVIASLQAMEALKLLSGNREQLNPAMTFVDLWNNQIRSIGVSASRSDDCPTCGQRDFAWLEGRRGSAITRLCGRNSVQIAPTTPEPVDLPALAQRLSAVGKVTTNSFLLRLKVDNYLLTLFADGRTIVGGTDDPAVARTVLAKYIGN
ncbi:MAG: thiazole biosynthesis adenylyltransferase ThiF [Planctomycetes bacterium]|nr:thiazole biosynthesis adenylyltransferase ThiF [Planctomycetota bacterium]